jgi:hypothetical protein
MIHVDKGDGFRKHSKWVSLYSIASINDVLASYLAPSYTHFPIYIHMSDWGQKKGQRL